MAGLLLSVLVVKPQSLWLVPVGLLIIREYRVLLGLLLGGLLWAAASIALVGPSQSTAWVAAVAGAGSQHIAISFGLPGLVGVAAGAGAGYVAFGVAGILAVALGVWFRVRLRANPELAIAIFVCVSLVLSPHVLAQDFVLLAPALSLAARWRPSLSLAAAAVLSIAFLPDLNLGSPNALLGFVAIAVATLAAVMALGRRSVTPNPPIPVAATLGAAP